MKAKRLWFKIVEFGYWFIVPIGFFFYSIFLAFASIFARKLLR